MAVAEQKMNDETKPTWTASIPPLHPVTIIALIDKCTSGPVVEGNQIGMKRRCDDIRSFFAKSQKKADEGGSVSGT